MKESRFNNDRSLFTLEHRYRLTAKRTIINQPREPTNYSRGSQTKLTQRIHSAPEDGPEEASYPRKSLANGQDRRRFTDSETAGTGSQERNSTISERRFQDVVVALTSTDNVPLFNTSAAAAKTRLSCVETCRTPGCCPALPFQIAR